jgi:hypothetical protein
MARHVSIECFRSDAVVIRTKKGEDVRKIFSVSFSRFDGSLFVNLPYFETSKGLLSIATIAGGQTGGDVDLKPQGKCSSHNVKYTHHLDGEAHFSQHGKIMTKVRRKSVPLRSNRGHLFTLMVQGLEHFKAADQPRDSASPNKKRTNLTVDLANESPAAMKFVGRLTDARLIGPMLTGEYPDRIGPCLEFRTHDGNFMQGFCIANPHDLSDQTLLMVTFHVIPWLDAKREAAMTFIGGFDPPEQVLDSTQTVSMLVLNYPAENFEELRSQLGSVDYVPGSN